MTTAYEFCWAEGDIEVPSCLWGGGGGVQKALNKLLLLLCAVAVAVMTADLDHCLKGVQTTVIYFQWPSIVQTQDSSSFSAIQG